MYRQRVSNPCNPLLPVNYFGTTHVGSYEPGISPANAFSDFDWLQFPSQNFLPKQNNVSSPDVKEHTLPFCHRQVGSAVTGTCDMFQFFAVNTFLGNPGRLK
jgi:hypothetical protein